MPPPLISVVILSYNRPELLRQSVRKCTELIYPSLEFIVVDNFSARSEEIRQVVMDFPQVRFLANAENIGFAGGMNLGVNAARGQYALLSEDDILLDENCLSIFLSFMQRSESAGLLSGTLLNVNNNKVRCAGGDLSLGYYYKNTILHEGASVENINTLPPYQCSFIPGCFIFAETEFLLRNGPFKEEFFMYCEDTELCLKTIMLGRKIFVVPQAVAYHFDPPKDNRENDIVSFHKRKNFLTVYLLYSKVLVLPIAASRYFVSFVFESIMKGDLLLATKLVAWLPYGVFRYLIERAIMIFKKKGIFQLVLSLALMGFCFKYRNLSHLIVQYP